ncbi:uncharacterized protein LOC123877979 isoform X4 [Maniola jurtina]|uniref:uncharacterized protein LOC123877979 isoform X4 n=1 Tax=Maniola jurtina TaxID=191418 RepID=UPI001E68B320|nr:uncharacterized protein LOC123877979 isoform X4 [Maniola jurtina]
MLLVIHNIPMHMKFYDVKNLIQEKCGFKEVILDNFTAEGNNNKRVTVGLADEGDAALLVRKINGLFLSGCQLFVEDMRQKKSSEQPYRPIDNPHVPQPRPDKIAQYNRPDARMPTGMPAQSAPSMTPMPPVQMAYSNLPFYMSPVQASYPTYENQAAQAASKPPLHAAYYPTQHQQPGVENQWNILPAYASQPAKQHSPAPVVNSRDSEWEERDPSRSPSRSPDRDDDWRDSKRHAEPSRSERGRRSPERDRERYGKKASKSSRRIESGGRSRRDIRDRSPPRSREDSRSSRHDEDLMQSKSSSYVERSPPRDRAFERHRRDDRRSFEQRDRRRSGDRRGRDRDRKRSPEKSRDYDNSDDDSDYDKHREDHEHDRRNYGKKNRYSYSDASSSSSKTYGNDPDNSTFSVSNANIFDKRGNARDDSFSGKESGTKRGSFDRKAAPTPKRARKDQDKDAGAAPKVDAAKPIEPPAPDMRKMIIRHNNWRYQVASILAQQIMSAARGPGPIPNKAHIFKELKKCVVARIDVRLGDTIVKSLMEMIESYRSRFPPEDDVTFFNAVMEKIEHDEKESAASAASGETSIDCQQDPGADASEAKQEETEEKGTEAKAPEVKRRKRRRGVKRLGGSRIGMIRLPKYKKKPPTCGTEGNKTSEQMNTHTGKLNKLDMRYGGKWKNLDCPTPVACDLVGGSHGGSERPLPVSGSRSLVDTNATPGSSASDHAGGIWGSQGGSQRPLPLTGSRSLVGTNATPGCFASDHAGGAWGSHEGSERPLPLTGSRSLVGTNATPGCFASDHAGRVWGSQGGSERPLPLTGSRSLFGANSTLGFSASDHAGGVWGSQGGSERPLPLTGSRSLVGTNATPGCFASDHAGGVWRCQVGSERPLPLTGSRSLVGTNATPDRFASDHAGGVWGSHGGSERPLPLTGSRSFVDTNATPGFSASDHAGGVWRSQGGSEGPLPLIGSRSLVDTNATPGFSASDHTAAVWRSQGGSERSLALTGSRSLVDTDATPGCSASEQAGEQRPLSDHHPHSEQSNTTAGAAQTEVEDRANVECQQDPGADASEAKEEETEEKEAEGKGTEEKAPEVKRRKRRRGVKRLGGHRIGMIRLPKYKKKPPTCETEGNKTSEQMNTHTGKLNKLDMRYSGKWKNSDCPTAVACDLVGGSQGGSERPLPLSGSRSLVDTDATPGCSASEQAVGQRPAPNHQPHLEQSNTTAGAGQTEFEDRPNDSHANPYETPIQTWAVSGPGGYIFTRRFPATNTTSPTHVLKTNVQKPPKIRTHPRFRKRNRTKLTHQPETVIEPTE